MRRGVRFTSLHEDIDVIGGFGKIEEFDNVGMFNFLSYFDL
jgi:hypothetical protein